MLGLCVCKSGSSDRPSHWQPVSKVVTTDDWQQPYCSQVHLHWVCRERWSHQSLSGGHLRKKMSWSFLHWRRTLRKQQTPDCHLTSSLVQVASSLVVLRLTGHMHVTCGGNHAQINEPVSLERVARRVKSRLNSLHAIGYCLSMCIRHCWGSFQTSVIYCICYIPITLIFSIPNEDFENWHSF